MGVSGDLEGDGFQNGGTIIVDKGGNLLYEYKQLDASEQISAEKILEYIGLEKNKLSG
jgi:prostamide/prostaglandin F2alpha synthase